MGRKILCYLLSTFLIVSILLTNPINSHAANSKREEFNGHYYKLFDQSYVWSDAEAQCEEMGGHLVTITSEDEQNFVSKMVAGGERNSYWLGGYLENGHWNWLKGEDFNQYRNWSSSQPDNYANSETKLSMYRINNPHSWYSSLGKWNDLKEDGTCNSESFFGINNIGYVCEWDSNSLNNTINKNDTADDILDKLQINDKFSAIKLAKDSITGPTVNIAGQEISLFKIDGEFDLPFSNIECKVDTSKKIIEVLIGFDEFNKSADLSSDNNPGDTYWKNSYKEVKNLYNGVTGKNTNQEFYNRFRKLRKHIKKYDGKMLVNAKCSVSGYAEFSYASGQIVFSEGKLILESSISTSNEWHVPSVPIVYLYLDLTADLNGEFSLTNDSAASQKLTYAMDPEIMLSLGLGGGVGKRDAINVEAGLKGTLDANAHISTADYNQPLSKHLSVSLSAKLLFKSQCFNFTIADYEKEFANYQIYPTFKNNNAIKRFGSHSMIDNLKLSEAKVYSSQYNTQTRLTENNNSNFSRKDLYEYNDPQLTELDDGTKLLIWVDKDTTKTKMNQNSLMYSVCINNSWSSPKYFAGSNGINDYPTVYSDGKNVTVIWQRVAEMNDDAKLTDLLASSDLYSSTFSDGSFSNVTRITSNNSDYEMLQSITCNGNYKDIVYLTNSENNPLQPTTSSNTIHIKTFDGNEWSTKVLHSDLPAINSIQTTYLNGKLIVVYEETKDTGNTIIINKDGVETKIDGNSSYLKGDKLYYYDNCAINEYNLSTATNNVIITGVFSGFTVATNGNYKAIITSSSINGATQLSYHKYEVSSNSWNNGIPIGKSNKYIRNLSPSLDTDGNLSAAINYIDILDKNNNYNYGSATLEVLDSDSLKDTVMLKGISYENSDVTPHNTMPLSFEMTNNGSNKVDTLNVEIMNEDGSILQKGSIDTSITSGETKELTYKYQLPESIKKENLILKVYQAGETDISNNTQKVVIGEPDIAINNLTLSKSNGNTYIKGNINNNGYDVAKDVKVTLKDNCGSGEIIGSVDLNDINSQSSSTFRKKISNDYLKVPSTSFGNNIYVSSKTSSEESDYSNNTNTYLIEASNEIATEIVDISNYKASLDNTSYTYDGTAKSPLVMLNNDADVRYIYTDNVDAGVASVKAQGVDDFTGEITRTFVINPLDINSCDISNISDQTYTGAEIKPVINVTYKGQKVDCNISYKNNIESGTATAIIKGKDNFCGAAERTFKINTSSSPSPVPTPISEKKLKKPGKNKITYLKSKKKSQITIKYSKISSVAGYIISYRKKGAKKWYKKLTKGTSYTIKNLKRKKTYQIRIRSYRQSNNRKIYSDYSLTKSMIVK